MITYKDKDGSFYGEDNQVIFFSFDKFKDKICSMGYCFVCGAAPNRAFNEEHVFPQWLIRMTGIHNLHLKLPNGSKLKYSTYTISCCASCNTLLGKIYEQPICATFANGFKGLAHALNNIEASCTLKAWLSLIFLKVHLRDFKNMMSLDRRDPHESIGSTYDLNTLHHIHAVARARIVGVEIDPNVFGSLFVIRIEPQSTHLFDYYDTLDGSTMLLRIKDIAIIYVLDDCGAVNSQLKDTICGALPKRLTECHLREIVAHYATANLHIKHRPRFSTCCYQDRKPNISVQLPNCEFLEYNPLEFGRILSYALQDYKDVIRIDGLSGDDALEKIRSGNITFLTRATKSVSQKKIIHVMHGNLTKKQ